MHATTKSGATVSLALLIIVIGMASVALADECVNLTDGQTLTDDALICRADYELPNGIKVIGQRIAIDCNKAVLLGTGTGVGITATGDIITLKNCIVDRYSEGIRLENVNISKLFSNTLTNNTIGIHTLATGYFAEYANTYINNDQDRLREEVVTLPETIPILSQPTDALIRKLGLVKADVDAARSLILLEKRARIADGKTTVLITLEPSEDVNVEVYEHIPKNIASSVDDIQFNPEPARIVDPDPDAALYIGKLRVKTKLTLNYTINKEVAPDEIDDTVTVISRQTVQETTAPKPPATPVATPTPEPTPQTPRETATAPAPTPERQPTSSTRDSMTWLVGIILIAIIAGIALTRRKKPARHEMPPAHEEL